jgi:hypothetical protein
MRRHPLAGDELSAALRQGRERFDTVWQEHWDAAQRGEHRLELMECATSVLN